jgi:hypothetical protein
MTSLVLIPLLLLGADEPRWKLAAEDDGIKVYGREREGSEVREMRAIGLIDATPQEIWKALRDLDAYTKTMPYTVEATVLKRSEGDKEILFYSCLDTPLVSKRDYIIKLLDESDWKEGKGFLKVSWTAVNDQDALKPVKDDIVRVRVNDGYWLLEPREDGKKTFTTYYIYTSPGGSIPNWIANKANGIAVPKVFAAIKKVVKDQRAAAAGSK